MLVLNLKSVLVSNVTITVGDRVFKSARVISSLSSIDLRSPEYDLLGGFSVLLDVQIADGRLTLDVGGWDSYGKSGRGDGEQSCHKADECSVLHIVFGKKMNKSACLGDWKECENLKTSWDWKLGTSV